MGSQQLGSLYERLTPKQQKRRWARIYNRKVSRGPRYDKREQRITRLFTGWTSRVVFALDWFRTKPQVQSGMFAVGTVGTRASDRKYGKYTPPVFRTAKKPESV